MATQAQTLANQQNAQHSTGPKTPEGKAVSSRNATKHGLSSAFTVLAHEDQDEFDLLLIELREEHEPANLHQVTLVEQLAKSQWLLARAQRLETAAFNHLAGFQNEPDSDPDARIIESMFKTNPNALALLQRYAAQAERSYYKAYRELKASKQIQNEADYVAQLSQTNVTRRVMNAPTPDHPGATSQYGYIPQMNMTGADRRNIAQQFEPNHRPGAATK